MNKPYWEKVRENLEDAIKNGRNTFVTELIKESYIAEKLLYDAWRSYEFGDVRNAPVWKDAEITDIEQYQEAKEEIDKLRTEFLKQMTDWMIGCLEKSNLTTEQTVRSVMNQIFGDFYIDSYTPETF